MRPGQSTRGRAGGSPRGGRSLRGVPRRCKAMWGDGRRPRPGRAETWLSPPPPAPASPCRRERASQAPATGNPRPPIGQSRSGQPRSQAGEPRGRWKYPTPPSWHPGARKAESSGLGGSAEPPGGDPRSPSLRRHQLAPPAGLRSQGGLARGSGGSPRRGQLPCPPVGCREGPSSMKAFWRASV